MHRSQLIIAVALILTEASAFAYFSDAWTVAIGVCVFSLLALTTEWRAPLIPSRRMVGALALALPFTVQWAFAPYEPAHIRTFILYSLAHAGGQYGLALQTAYLWVKRSDETWSAVFPVCGVCILLAAGDVQTTHFTNVVFQVFVLIFILLTVAYFSLARIALPEQHTRRSSGRVILSAVALAITCSAAVIGSGMLERSWSTIERIYTEWMLQNEQEGSVGFSRQARLGSISERGSASDEVPVLRIYAKEEPGYLRGAAFDRYRAGNWLSDAPRTERAPLRELSPTLSSQFLYRLSDTNSPPLNAVPGALSQGTWTDLEVWPTGAVSDAIFAPLEARWVSVALPYLFFDNYGIAYPDDLPPQASYHALLPSKTSDASQNSSTDGSPLSTEATEDELARLTAIPENLDPKVVELAKTILTDCVTPEQKVLAVSGWFRKNYHYELGMKVPAGQDPLTHFLIRRPPAHCEYFASGTAVLLRLGGVPCRYVTGFVATEYNYLGGYWLVRNKDAHAWVEALLPGRGWVTVESTPSTGIPHSSHSIQPRHLWDDLVLRIQMLRTELVRGTWRGAWRAFKIVISMLLTTPHGWLMLCGLMAWGVVLWRRHVRFTFKRRLDPVSTEFHRLLSELDRQLNRLSIRREPQETLHQFASRLETSSEPSVREAADWYRAYADLRYRATRLPEDFSNLRTELAPLVKNLKHLPRSSRPQ